MQKEVSKLKEIRKVSTEEFPKMQERQTASPASRCSASGVTKKIPKRAPRSIFKMLERDSGFKKKGEVSTEENLNSSVQRSCNILQHPKTHW